MQMNAREPVASQTGNGAIAHSDEKEDDDFD